MRDTFVCMANNLGSQQELIVLSVLQTISDAGICNFSPLQKRDEEYPGLFLGSSLSLSVGDYSKINFSTGKHLRNENPIRTHFNDSFKIN